MKSIENFPIDRSKNRFLKDAVMVFTQRRLPRDVNTTRRPERSVRIRTGVDDADVLTSPTPHCVLKFTTPSGKPFLNQSRGVM